MSPTTAPTSVEARYLSAADPLEWLDGELAAFFDGDIGRVAELRESLEGRWERFAGSLIEPGELIAFEARVERDDHSSSFATRELPHPVELLWVLCHNAEFGDVVQIAHHRVGGVEAVALRWPFSVDDAIIATSPELGASATATGEYRTVTVTGPNRVGVAAAAAVAAGVAVHLWHRLGRGR